MRDGARREQGLSAIPDDVKAEQLLRGCEQAFWCLASKAEAHFGLGEMELFDMTRTEAQAYQPAAWMMDSFATQIDKLRVLLRRHGHLLSPAWRESPSGI